MGLSDLKNVFPTKLHAVIFVGYMGLFINQGILTTATKDKKHGYPYNTITAVFLTAFIKLLVAGGVYSKEAGVSALFTDAIQHSKLMLSYFVPAFMYSLYNNLAFHNLASYDPTTYFLLLQFRVVVTGVVFQILFKKQLSRMQWFSLLLLTVGCIVKQLDISSGGVGTPKISFTINLSLGLIMVQILCSCFAGVYNEYLLKGKGDEVPFMIQNIYMYGNELICNIVFLSYSGQLSTAFTKQSIDSILQPKVVLIVLNNAAVGIVTAMFLRSLNSILKTFASALELMFTAVLCWFIFGIPISIMTIVAIAIVSYASIMYAKNPVDNTPKKTNETTLKV